MVLCQTVKNILIARYPESLPRKTCISLLYITTGTVVSLTYRRFMGKLKWRPLLEHPLYLYYSCRSHLFRVIHAALDIFAAQFFRMYALCKNTFFFVFFSLCVYHKLKVYAVSKQTLQRLVGRGSSSFPTRKISLKMVPMFSPSIATVPSTTIHQKPSHNSSTHHIIFHFQPDLHLCLHLCHLCCAHSLPIYMLSTLHLALTYI